MSEEKTIVVPLLHRDEHLAGLCPELLWLCPGLPCMDESGGYLPVSWPLSATEAALCLKETEQLAQSGLSGEELRSAYAAAQTEQRLRDEARAARGALRNEAPSVPDVEAVRREAQRLLLFAWEQEERVMEISRLAAKFDNAAHTFRHVLHGSEGEDSKEFGGAHEDGLDDGLSDVDDLMSPDDPFAGFTERDAWMLMPDWRAVLERLAIFLPDEAALCIHDTRMIESLEERGLCGQSLTDAGLACPQALEPVSARVLGERMPLWRLLGYAHAQPHRPWLDIERLVATISS